MTTTSTDTQTLMQIANDVVAHCKAGNPDHDFVEYDSQIWEKHFADNWVSIEGDGKVYNGREALVEKYKQWQAGVTVHACEVTGPFMGQDSFSVIFDLDMEANDGSFPRMKMREIAVYTVENSKIVKEEFCYLTENA
ncbi:MAG: SnoaL-like domain-containing protein [Phycisphaerales bacterium]